jgi:hypothetical protein
VVQCHQPLCQQLLAQRFNFILVCRPESHTTLYEHLEGIDLPTVTAKRWTGKIEETYTYRYLNAVPLKDDEDALLVNWCELSVSHPDGKVVYKNSFATNHPITDDTVAEIVLAGRTRWKVENENNNTLNNSPDSFLNEPTRLSGLTVQKLSYFFKVSMSPILRTVF